MPFDQRSILHSIHTFSKNNFVFNLSGNLLLVIAGHNFYVSFSEILQWTRGNQADDTTPAMMFDAASKVLPYLIQAEYRFNYFLIVVNHALFAISSGLINHPINIFTNWI
jgi:hypothetical protein